jgi:hypothetical protein
MLLSPPHRRVGLMHDRMIGALETCCRQGEMLRIQNRDVDWDQHHIAIPCAHSKDMENRRIPFALDSLHKPCQLPHGIVQYGRRNDARRQVHVKGQIDVEGDVDDQALDAVIGVPDDQAHCSSFCSLAEGPTIGIEVAVEKAGNAPTLATEATDRGQLEAAGQRSSQKN